MMLYNYIFETLRKEKIVLYYTLKKNIFLHQCDLIEDKSKLYNLLLKMVLNMKTFKLLTWYIYIFMCVICPLD